MLAARRGRWALATLAAATRNAGVLLVILLPLYLYGPRGKGSPTPGNRVRADALWIAPVPIGLLAFVLTNVAAFGDALANWHAEAYWHRGFAGPFSALWEGIAPALAAARHLLSGHPSTGVLQKLALLGVGLAAVVALVGVCRRLPPACGAYSAAALVRSLSAPEQGHPLASSSRYVLTIFPLFMWLGSYLQKRRRIAAAVLAVFTLGLVYCSARFATWHWVA